MAWIRSEEEVDKMIEEMKFKSKSKYITQGVTFSKNSERHMELLKFALMHSSSFSGLGKELLAEKYDNRSNGNTNTKREEVNNEVIQPKGDTGNFF